MVSVTDNVLIVEDELDWCRIYEDVAVAHGMHTIRAAHDLSGAEALLDTMKFAVAFVDIGLDVNDDRNIDGLRVMAKIREMGDETAIIVVTGRSGKDVLPITRDALKLYDAFDTVGKVPLDPDHIAGLLTGGLEAYRTATGNQKDEHALHGTRESWDWEYEMLQAIPVRGGAVGLHDLLNRLVGRFLPLVATSDSRGLSLESGTSVAHGAYWSRAVGSAVLITFGPTQAMEALATEAAAGHELFGSYKTRALLHSTVAGKVHGAVYELPQMLRTEFD
jgi:CheY-like chemotaxis protein